MSHKEKLKVAVIGLGNMGKNHARVFFELSECELIAIADINEKVGEELSRKFGCRFYKDYHRMLMEEELDAVSIVVPTSKHEEVAIAAIQKGKHVFLEKPIADTQASAKRIIAAAKTQGVKLMIGHIERFNPAIQKLKAIVEEGQLGKITSIIARRVGVAPPQIKDANVIVDLAVHDIDIINHLLDSEVKDINVNSGKAILTDREDHAEIFLKYSCGASGYVQVNWITPIKIRNISVTGTKGYAEVDYINQTLVMHEAIYEKEFDDFKDLVVRFGAPKKVEFAVEKKEPLKEELRSFITSVIENKPEAVSGEDGLLALRIALESMEAKK